MDVKELVKLIETGDLPGLTEAIDNGADKNSLDPDWPGISLLQWSVMWWQKWDIALYLLSIDVDLSPRDNNDKGAFHHVLERLLRKPGQEIDREILIIKTMIEKGANLFGEDRNGLFPLHYAACGGDISLIDFMLEKGADIDAVSRIYNAGMQSSAGTPLMICISRKEPDLDIIRHLVEKGADLTIRAGGKTAIDLAAEHRSKYVVAAIEDGLRRKAERERQRIEKIGNAVTGDVPAHIRPRKFKPKAP